MAERLSNNQVDELGKRLRSGVFSFTDINLLDRHHESFTDAHNFVVGTIKNELDINPTERRRKSILSIIDKLNREPSIRLSQIQDISGCRIIVSDLIEQDSVVKTLEECLKPWKVHDIRDIPHHGYRAVHLIVKSNGRCIEVQVRTKLQDLWAEMSEKLADKVDDRLKYGCGHEPLQDFLMKLSAIIAETEDLISEQVEIRNLQHDVSSHGDMMEVDSIITKLKTQIDKSIIRILEAISAVSHAVDDIDKGGRNDFLSGI